jgi:hypothetical protein
VICEEGIAVERQHEKNIQLYHAEHKMMRMMTISAFVLDQHA